MNRPINVTINVPPIDIHIHYSPSSAPDDVGKLLGEILEGIRAMSAELDRLTASVAAETTIDASILTLVTGMADQIRANATDPAALNALADQIDAENAKLAAAVSANTPPAP